MNDSHILNLILTAEHQRLRARDTAASTAVVLGLVVCGLAFTVYVQWLLHPPAATPVATVGIVAGAAVIGAVIAFAVARRVLSRSKVQVADLEAQAAAGICDVVEGRYGVVLPTGRPVSEYELNVPAVLGGEWCHVRVGFSGGVLILEQITDDDGVTLVPTLRDLELAA